MDAAEPLMMVAVQTIVCDWDVIQSLGVNDRWVENGSLAGNGSSVETDGLVETDDLVETDNLDETGDLVGTDSWS